MPSSGEVINHSDDNVGTLMKNNSIMIVLLQVIISECPIQL